MSHPIEFIHYSTIALAVGATALGVGIGQGLTGATALQAINQQPQSNAEISRAAMLGMAFLETAAVIGLFVAVILILSSKPKPITLYSDLASIGIIMSICVTGFVLGIACAKPACAALLSIARQPFESKRILTFMILAQALIQTPVIAALVVAIFIRNQAIIANNIGDSLRLIASGLSIGLGSIGPAIGLAEFTKTACGVLGTHPKSYRKMLSFTLISQALIETPIIFAFVISISLLFVATIPQEGALIKGIAYIAAGLCAGLGTLGTGIGSGKTAAAACVSIAHDVRYFDSLSRISLLAQGLIETCTIYAMIIAFILVLIQ
jgi:F0F1-type ATP synthase membrane subunit c/vacuolar-type H+-ATPase subunit K